MSVYDKSAFLLVFMVCAILIMLVSIVQIIEREHAIERDKNLAMYRAVEIKLLNSK